VTNDVTWYSASDIHFNRDQMLFLIEWLPVLESGDWPANPQKSGYIDAPGFRKSHSHRARFETPAQFFAEVTDRLKPAGKDGATLVWEVQHGLTDYEALAPVAKQVLNYISGWRRRRMSFSSWVKQQKYRGK